MSSHPNSSDDSDDRSRSYDGNNNSSLFHKPSAHPPYFRSSALHENLTESHPMTAPLLQMNHTKQDDDYNSIPSQPTAAGVPQKRSGKQMWGILRNHVEQESFQITNVDHDEEQNAGGASPSETDDMPYDFTLRECALALALYLGVAVAAFSFGFENWKVSDSMYFACVTFTTIGYGDLTPTSKAGKLFTAVFALAGIAVLSIALGVVGSKIIESEARAVEKAEKEIVKDILHVFERKDSSGASRRKSRLFRQIESWAEDQTGGDSFSEDNDDDVTEDSTPRCRWFGEIMAWTGLVCQFLFRYAPALLPLFIAAYFIAHHEGWTWYDSIYYCVVTATTIGYGDLSPESDAMRWFAVAFIPLSVGAMGHFLGTIANMIIERRRMVSQKKLWKLDLKLGDLAAMDANNDGVVSELEFVEFMLLTMRKVDKETLDHIHAQFRKLDLTHSGTLVRQDLELMAKKRLHRAGHKLRLSTYKSKLLRQSSSVSDNASGRD